MKFNNFILGFVWVSILATRIYAQDSDVDLQTKWTGQAPTHETPTSAALWMQNPLDLQLEMVVTNFFAATNAYLEIDIAGQKKIFYGAGIDQYGDYIQSNYPPVEVDASVRRQYQMTMICPNSGPDGSQLFQWSDLNGNAGYFAGLITNSVQSGVSPLGISWYLWTNFYGADQFSFTNIDTSVDPAYEELVWQTNLVAELNRIITSGPLYTAARFSDVTLASDTLNLLAQNPQGQSLVTLNRLLLRDAYGFNGPSTSRDFSGTAQVILYVQPPPEITISKLQNPPQYTILANETSPQAQENSDGSAEVALINPGTGYVSTNTALIQLQKDKFGHFSVGDGCDDPRPAAGTGKWLTMGPGCNGDINRISLKWGVSLGRTFDGQAAGQLSLAESSLSQNTYTPYSLYYNASGTNIINEATLVTTNMAIGYYINTNYVLGVGMVTNITTNTDLVLRQIGCEQAFVDITTPDTNQTVLNFYYPNQVGTNRDQNGVFTCPTNPFVSWTIKNPNPGTTNNLLIIESRNGLTTTQSLTRAISGPGVTWTLTQGSGTAARVETRTVSLVGSPATNRVEVDTIANSGGAQSYQCQETYHYYPWGWELTQTSIPNSPTNLVTTYEFYDNLNNPENYSLNGNGQLKQITYPDGYWEKRIYEDLNDGADVWTSSLNSGGAIPGLLCYKLQPYLNSDGEHGEATGPDDATPANTIFTKYGYYGIIYGGTGQGRDQVVIDGLDGMVEMGNVWESSQATLDDSGTDEGPANETQDWTPYCEDNPNSFHGSYTDMYADSAPPGLAGKNYRVLMFNGPGHNVSSGVNYLFTYYDQGIYDTVSNVFDLNTTNHLYNLNPANNYPDHLESDLINCNNGGYALNSIDGHNLFSVNPIPLVTVKKTRIYHGGNLVQTEQYLYLCAGVTNEDGSLDDAQWVLLNKTKYYNDSLGRATNVVLIDGSTTRTLYTADYRGGAASDGELLLSETDENGQITTNSYDPLQHITGTTIVGHGTQPNISITNAYDSNGQETGTVETGGGLSLSQSWSYDLDGRQTSHTDQSGITVTTAYSNNNQTSTDTYPGGITQVHTQYVDRRKKSLTGNGVVNAFYSYGLYDYTQGGNNPAALGHMCVNDLWPETITTLGTDTSPRWTATGVDASGFDALKVWPLGGGTTNTAYDERLYENGFLSQEFSSSGLPTKSFIYDATGALAGEVSDTAQLYDFTGYWNFDNFIGDIANLTRISFTNFTAVQISGNWFWAHTNYVYLSDNSGEATVAGVHLEQINGFASGQTACAIDYDADTNETITTTYVDRPDNILTTVTAEPATSSLSATQVFQNGLPVSSSTLSVASPTLYFYDALGRTNRLQSPLGYSASINYDPITGWVTSQTDFTGQTTSYQYYGVTQTNAGKLFCQTSATGKKTYYTYTTQGQLYQTWGEVPYPAQYQYNEYGDLTNLTTYRAGSGWIGASWPNPNPSTGDNTYWYYDAASGALTNKTDAQTNLVTYAYDGITGRLLARSWARLVGGVPVSVTNSYDGFGDLVEQDYNDGTASVQYNNYSRAAQPREVVDASGTSELTYDYANRLVATYYESGLLAGITVSNHFNAAWGRDAVAVLGLSAPLEADYGYDPNSGRLASVTSSNCSAQYAYAPNSDLLANTTFKNGASTVLTTTRTWDYGTRLHSIANLVNGTPVTSHSYAYDALNRRTAAQLEDGSTWQYGYDDRDELTTASRIWAPWLYDAPVAGQQFSYAYDNIGNRLTAASGGDTNGWNLRTNYYSVNGLNQYSGIVTPGYQSIIGAALATNSVTVNGGVADRKAEYFHREIAVANGSGPVWQNVTNISGTFTNRGGLVVPAASQSLVYDADGNLTSDGIWTYQWDGESRLMNMAMQTDILGLANSNCLRLDFIYDYMGRRVQKIVSAWGGADFTLQSTNYFVYEGWNLLAVVNPQSAILQSFIWGQDLSGTMDQAGGVGGLLMATFSGTNCFAGYGGSGNVTALINATDKSLVACYEYSPYGQLLRSTGQLSRQNPFRFSTKYWDDETGLIYYPSRYYSPNLARWFGRDTKEEYGGINLYAFTLNNPVNGFDPLGQSGTTVDTITAGAEGAAMDGQGAGDAIGFLNRVEDLKERSDDAQQFAADLMDASTGDSTDLYISLLQNCANAVSKGIAKKARVGGGGTLDGHHIFPQAFKDQFQAAGIDVDKWVVNIDRTLHRQLHSGSGKGGAWNAAWAAALKETAKLNKNDRLNALMGKACSMVWGLF